MEFVLSVSRHIVENKGDRVLRICLETNGNIEPRFLVPISKLSLGSGGGLKFDLKFHSPYLQKALCGAGNEQALSNFRSLKAMNSERREPPFLRASTLIVPGYVDAEEVKGLAELVAEVDPAIPYSLLAFHPCYLMSDLPRCTSKLMEECRRAALSAGLERVRIGNPFLIA
jgi:pyruvate formate lyase activating enzyme